MGRRWGRTGGTALLLLAAAACCYAANERTEVGSPVCKTACYKHGTCGPDGKCRCPFGRLGESCEVDFLNPCKLAPMSIPNCGLVVTKSCECMRRCEEYFCHALAGEQEKRCQGFDKGWHHHYVADRGCYEREGVPPDEQYSRIPEPEETNVKCYGSHQKGTDPINCTEALYNRGGDAWNVPASLCPENCNDRGYCVRWPETHEGPGSCRCHRGYKGPACEEEVNYCYKECSGRGTCVDQFCHCQPPYFSIGCTLSKVYPTNHSRPNPANFKIYMYEVNTQWSYETAAGVGLFEFDEIYIAEQQFIDQFLNSPVRTDDPSEASLFFIPSFSYGYAGNIGSPDDHLNLLIDHIRNVYPWWNKTGGRDHFVFTTMDRGSCHLTGLAQAPIKVTHFGYHATPGNRAEAFPADFAHPEYGCLHPLRDVVAVANEPTDGRMLDVLNNIELEELLAMKRTLFFFAGSNRADEPEYSGGTRKILAELIDEWDDPEFQFVELLIGQGYFSTPVMRASKFCFAPYGHGWGNRVLQAVMAGCVPVIVQEHVVQAFEELLPYHDFSIRLNNADLPRMREILRAVNEEQYARLLTNVMRYHRAFSWNADKGGQAFEYTILALRRRHLNLKSLLY